MPQRRRRDHDGTDGPERRAHDETNGPEPRAHARGIWSGSITFGLVTVPVELFTAERRGGVPLRMLSPEGRPLSRQYVCPDDGEPVANDELVRGYAIDKNEFVPITDEELDELAPRRSRDIELSRFVDRAAIDPGYFVRSYFMLPAAEQTKAYRLLAATMEASGRAALASFVMRGKAYAVAIFADKGILRAETLRFGDELRTAEDVGLPKPVEVDTSRIGRMKQAIESIAADRFDEAALVDRESERLLALAEAKRARGEDVVQATETAAAAEPPGEEVLDLMTLLQERLGESPGVETRGRSTDRAKRPRRAAAARPKKAPAAHRSARGGTKRSVKSTRGARHA